MNLEKFFSIILRGIVFPIRSLLLFATVAAIIPLATVFLLLGSLFLVPILSLSTGLGFLKGFFLFTPLAWIATILAAAVATVFLVIYSPINIVLSFWSGLKSGYEDGMRAFWRAFNSPAVSLLNLGSRIFEAIRSIELGRVFDLAYVWNLVRATAQDFDLEARRIAPPQALGLLTEQEKIEIRALVNQGDLTRRGHGVFTCEITPWQQVLFRLNARFIRYEALSRDLNRLRIEQENPAEAQEILDEVVLAREITLPILFLKQYQDMNGEWRCVPGSSRISDRYNLKQHFSASLNPVHEAPEYPEGHAVPDYVYDNIQRPAQYQNRDTQYVYHVLDGQSFNSQELNEGVVEIRELLLAARQRVIDYYNPPLNNQAAPVHMPPPINFAGMPLPLPLNEEENNIYQFN